MLVNQSTIDNVSNNRWGNFEYVRPELTDLLWQYDIVRDCVENKVKNRGTVYLPMPNPDDETESSSARTARYSSYSTRAIFYNVTGRTLNGLVGQVFANEPDIKLPDSLKNIVDDVSGKGVTLVQSAKEAVEQTLAYGRCGLYTDYPKLQFPASKRQLQNGEMKPSINIYSSENIINWQYKKINERQVLALVVLAETAIIEIDSFRAKKFRSIAR